MIEGTVEVKGKVSVDNSAKLDNLKKAARRAREDNNTDQSFKYYEQLSMEDPDNWEAVFFVAYYSALNKLKNDREGGSVQVNGNTVSLVGNYRSGIEPSIKTIANCLDSVFNLIEDIKDYEEQEAAAETVSGYVKSVSNSLNDIISSEYFRMSREISDFGRQTENGAFKQMSMYKQNDKTKKAYNESVSDMLALVEKRKQRLEEVVGKRRFDEYWAAHQPEKTELESEKQYFTDQIAALNEEITTVPQKTEGYSTMVELQKKVENLTAEKKALGLFKLKEKKAVQVQIDAINNEIAPIQARINAGIEEVQKRISPLQSKIEAINTELTRPR